MILPDSWFPRMHTPVLTSHGLSYEQSQISLQFIPNFPNGHSTREDNVGII